MIIAQSTRAGKHRGGEMGGEKEDSFTQHHTLKGILELHFLGHYVFQIIDFV